jgi:TolB-like protein
MAGKGVFLSYASQDAPIASRIGDAMRLAGLEVWFDQSELRGGDVWDETIRRQIAECALFVPIISRTTASRLEGYFRLEWTLADQRTQRMARTKTFILPVCIDDTRESGSDVPESFVRVQWSRLSEGQDPAPFVARVKSLLDAEKPSIQPPAPESSAAEARTIVSPRAKQISPRMLLIGVAVGAVVVAILGWFASRHSPEQPTVAPPTAALPPAPPPASTAATVSDRSIAVLPFIDLSEKHDQEYFSDGLSEELLDLLAQVPELKVAARTSSFYFKGRAEDVATIGQRLRVAHLLEGSVRKAGNKVRVTAQLIRADNGYHLWSKTYDRDINDIFKVQDEISNAVVEALKVHLLASKPLVNRHQTDNTEAYSQYLWGKQLRLRDVPETIGPAIDAFRRAIALDPNYAAAYSALSDAEWRMADQSTNNPEEYARAAADAERAISLAPDAPEGYWARGNLRFVYYYDWSGAQADFSKAHDLDPAYVPAAVELACLTATLGKLPQSIEALRQVVTEDPLSGLAWRRLTQRLLDARRFDQALEAVTHLDSIADGGNSKDYRGDALLLQGRPAEALQRYRAYGMGIWREHGSAMAEHSLKNEAESNRQLELIMKKAGDALSYQYAEVYAWRNDKDAAFKWLDRALQLHDGGLIYLKHDIFMDNLRHDPRYAALLKKLGLPQ